MGGGSISAKAAPGGGSILGGGSTSGSGSIRVDTVFYYLMCSS